MSEDDAAGCAAGGAFAALLLALLILALWATFRTPTPQEVVEKQRMEQRAADDRELAEWTRTQQLREMRADKAKAEEPK